jgi:hypothetical protein
MSDLFEIVLDCLLCFYICCPSDDYTEYPSNNSQCIYQDVVYNNIPVVNAIPIKPKHTKRE